MAPSMLQNARGQGELRLVSMNEVKYLRFEPKAKICLGTENLNSCTAVVILSKNAAILGHFSPRPPSANANTAAGDAHIKAKMGEVRTLLSQHLQDFAQKPGSTGIVAYAVYMGVTALQSQKAYIEAQFAAWKMQLKSIPYHVLEADDPREPAKGTLLIVPKDGRVDVYVEDKFVVSAKGTASSSTGLSVAESSKASSK
ncbi:MAG: hypothetical protein Q9217_006356 [Psora testacea]